jgi:Fe-S cluster biogenesis protein NfuA
LQDARQARFLRISPKFSLAYSLLPESRQETLKDRGLLMVSRERVETVLQRIRPLLQADGGDIELLGVDGNNARVRLTGMCAGCPSAHMTLYLGVEMALRDEIREFEQLEVV